jgi:hypothetical protein
MFVVGVVITEGIVGICSNKFNGAVVVNPSADKPPYKAPIAPQKEPL